MVWLPAISRMDAEELERQARRVAQRIADRRVSHFLDVDAALGELYPEIINLPRGDLAWDVYLVFGREARWEESLPHPDYWMHQLARPSDTYLEGEKLARVVMDLLGKHGQE
ncbi:MAG: hypothetical protein HY653_04140 [Acidobacteria bacterium]|nr:hypothetical protein [Acidobacteriota bacterium]